MTTKPKPSSKMTKTSHSRLPQQLFLLALLAVNAALAVDCIYEDRLHSRNFNFSAFEQNYNTLENQDLYISFCSDIPESEIAKRCNIDKIQGSLIETFMIHKIDPATKTCYLFRKWDVDFMTFDFSEKALTMFVSNKNQFRPGSNETLAYKVKIETPVQTDNSGTRLLAESQITTTKRLREDVTPGGIPKITNSEENQKNTIFAKNSMEALQSQQPSLEYFPRTDPDYYDQIKYSLPHKRQAEAVEIVADPYLISNVSISLFDLVTIPRFLMVLYLIGIALGLHLNMPKAHYPLQHNIFLVNWFYCFLAVNSIINFKEIWLNSVFMVLFLAIAATTLQFIPIKLRLDICLWSSLILISQAFCETVDLFDRFYYCIITEILAFATLFGIGKVMVMLRGKSKLPQGVSFDDEILCSVLLSINICLNGLKAVESFRIPAYAVNLIKMKSTVPQTDKRVMMGFWFCFFLIGFMVGRMGIVLVRRRPKSVMQSQKGLEDDDYWKGDALLFMNDSLDDSGFLEESGLKLDLDLSSDTVKI